LTGVEAELPITISVVQRNF